MTKKFKVGDILLYKKNDTPILVLKLTTINGRQFCDVYSFLYKKIYIEQQLFVDWMVIK